jgi:RNA polymerase sigma-70 factor, ECF subfamily
VERAQPAEAIRLRAVTPSRPGTRRDDPGQLLLGLADVLYDLAWHLTRDRGEAEDLVQEAFARALRAWSQFEPGTDLKAWVLRILRNAWLDRCRHERRSPVSPAAGEDPEEGAPPPAEDGSLRGDVELGRLRGLVARDIENALSGLGEEQRTVILLDLEGLTEAEMSSVMGCLPGTVKSRLSRARAALRARLLDYRR